MFLLALALCTGLAPAAPLAPFAGGYAWANDPVPTACPYDAEEAAVLLDNLASRFAEGGADASLDNTTMYAALALNALGRGDDIDAAALLDNLDGFEAAMGYPIPAGTLAKYLMALTAAGVDCTSVPAEDGTSRNLVDKMKSLIDPAALDIYSAVFILPVFGHDRYPAEGAPMTVDDLVALILASRNADGLFGSALWDSFDAQTSAQAVMALVPFAEENAEVQEAIEQCTAAILALQNPDGGFPTPYSSGASDVDTTANVVAMLAALGYDPCGGTLETENGSTPAGFLLSKADAGLDGYDSAGSWDEGMTAATALMGLAGARGLVAAGGAFDVYVPRDVPAADDPGASDEPGSPDADNPGGGAEPAGDQTDEQASDASKQSEPATEAPALAKTGDGGMQVAVAAGAAALLACAALGQARRCGRRAGKR